MATTTPADAPALVGSELPAEPGDGAVIVCDTVADARAVSATWGECALTWPGRRASWHAGEWSVLRGRRVVVLSAASNAARERARAIAAHLHELGVAELRIGIAEGDDRTGPAEWIEAMGEGAARGFVARLLKPWTPDPKRAASTRPAAPSAAIDIDAGWIDTNPHYRVLGLADDAVVVRLASGVIMRRQRERLTTPGPLIAMAPRVWWCSKTGDEKLTKDAALAIGDVLIRAADRRGPYELDTDPHLVGLPDGRIVDLRTGAAREASEDADRYVMGRLGAVPLEGVPGAWLATLEEMFGGGHREAIAFVQRWMGYMLTGFAHEHRFLVLHGPAGRGKSTLLSVMQAVAGSYFAGINPRGLFGAYGDHMEFLMRLKGRRLASVDDAPVTGWRAPEINALVSGEVITARGMGTGSEDFTSTAKLVFTCNALPEISPPNPGINRRIMPLEVAADIRMDPTRRRDLHRELGQITAWAIEGARMWYRDGLAPTSIIESAALDFAKVADVLGAWLDDTCQFGPDFTVTMRELQKSFHDWSDGRRLSARAFRSYVSHPGKYEVFPVARHGNARGYRGLRLKPPGWHDDE